jgi:hypothetical protein
MKKTFIYSIMMFAVCIMSPQNTVYLLASCSARGSKTVPSIGNAVLTYSGRVGCTDGSSDTVSGIITKQMPLIGISLTFYASVTTSSSYNNSILNNGLTFAGNGNFSAIGFQAIMLNGQVTPAATG